MGPAIASRTKMLVEVEDDQKHISLPHSEAFLLVKVEMSWKLWCRMDFRYYPLDIQVNL